MVIIGLVRRILSGEFLEKDTEKIMVHQNWKHSLFIGSKRFPKIIFAIWYIGANYLLYFLFLK
jgi:hypothetical protein